MPELSNVTVHVSCPRWQPLLLCFTGCHLLLKSTHKPMLTQPHSSANTHETLQCDSMVLQKIPLQQGIPKNIKLACRYFGVIRGPRLISGFSRNMLPSFTRSPSGSRLGLPQGILMWFGFLLPAGGALPPWSSEDALCMWLSQKAQGQVSMCTCWGLCVSLAGSPCSLSPTALHCTKRQTGTSCTPGPGSVEIVIRVPTIDESYYLISDSFYSPLLLFHLF